MKPEDIKKAIHKAEQCPRCGAETKLANHVGNLLKVCADGCGYRICMN